MMHMNYFQTYFQAQECFCCWGNKHELRTSPLVPNNKSMNEKQEKQANDIHESNFHLFIFEKVNFRHFLLSPRQPYQMQAFYRMFNVSLRFSIFW